MNEPSAEPYAPLVAELLQLARERGMPFLVSVFDAQGQHIVHSATHFPASCLDGIRRRLPGQDMAAVRGHEPGKRALEVGASGHHNILLVGPPGAGKTLLARALPSILPGPVPFRAPTHGISYPEFAGSATLAWPGELTFAHGGILFLENLPAFDLRLLSAVRQAVEEQVVVIRGGQEETTFPAHFSLVASMWPCACGYYGDPVRECRCSAQDLQAYYQPLEKILSSCFDIHIEVARLSPERVRDKTQGEPSARVRLRVLAARERQEQRFGDRQGYFNAQMGGDELERWCHLDAPAQRLLTMALQQLHLSVGESHRILRVSRTIADLAGDELVAAHHIAEAIQYRSRWAR
jgi:magnesium chelatase family protein